MHVAFVSIYNPFCVGMRSIAAYLREAGHDVSITHFKWFEPKFIPRDDTQVHNDPEYERAMVFKQVTLGGDVFCPFPRPATQKEKELLVEHLKRFRPGIIGITLTSVYLPMAKELTALLHEHFPGVPIVWGGVQPMLCPEECLDFADIVCVSEGEEAMLELANDPGKGNIDNLWRKTDNGSIVKTPVRPLIQDLDDLPFPLHAYNEATVDWDKIDTALTTNKQVIGIHQILQSTRGCPFSCTYCIHGTIRPRYKGQKYHRRRSVDNVMKYIEYMVNISGMDKLCFWDDVFLMGEKWLNEFAEVYPKHFDFPFGGYGHPHFTTEPILEKMMNIGLYFLAMGIQTGSERLNKEVYNRLIPNKKTKALADLAPKLGVTELVYDLLTNNPYETEQDCRATLELLFELPKPTKFTLSKLRMFPHCKINTLNAPKGNLSETTFHFWNILYLMATSPLFPDEDVREWSQNDELKENPYLLERLAAQVLRENEEKVKAIGERETLCGEKQALQETLNRRYDESLRIPFSKEIRRLLSPFASHAKPKAGEDKTC